MVKLCIDTNYFINFYQKAGTDRKIFQQLMEITSTLLFPEQILNEFKRNRVKVIHGLINGMNERFREEIPIYPNTLTYQLFTKRKELNKKKEDLKNIHKEIITYFEQLIKNPHDDVIYQFVINLYNDPNTTKIPIDHEIIKEAQKRNFLGNPPFSSGNSNGDEIIFESLLSVCSEDLIIVTNDDRGFKIHEQYLKEEYYSKKTATLTVLNDLNPAMEAVGKEPTKEIKKFDQAKIVNPFVVASPSGSEFPSGGVYIRFPTVGSGFINVSPTSFSDEGTVSFMSNYPSRRDMEFP